jgi:hypothetical protein
MALTMDDKRWIAGMVGEAIDRSVGPAVDKAVNKAIDRSVGPAVDKAVNKAVGPAVEREMKLVVEVVRENRELIMANAESIREVGDRVDGLESKIDGIDRKLTVITDHQGRMLDRHEKRIRRLEAAVV